MQRFGTEFFTCATFTGDKHTRLARRGILDDLMLANRGDHIFVVVNAACKVEDTKHLRDNLTGCSLEEINDGFDVMHHGHSIRSVVVYE